MQSNIFNFIGFIFLILLATVVGRYLMIYLNAFTDRSFIVTFKKGKEKELS